MRNLLRNTQVVFYRLYEGEEEVIDAYGNSTGAYIPRYGKLQSALLCVSPNKGTSETEQFGSIEQYDRTMTTADTNCPIDEDDVLWIDGADTNGPWNYIVKQRAPWRNSLTFAVASVTVSEYEAIQAQTKQAMRLKEAASVAKVEMKNAKN